MAGEKLVQTRGMEPPLLEGVLVMTNALKLIDRPFPDGYTEDHDSSVWNVGEVFSWSEVHECWLDCNVRLTIKPNVPIALAFEDLMGCPMWDDYAVFFNCAFV